MKYYSNAKVLSYNTPWLFTLGNRSTGKTFNWTEYLIRKWTKNRRKFIYMRRYDEDLKKVIPTFFDNNAFMHPEMEFDVMGSKSGAIFKINGEDCGIAVALSVANKYKSIGMADYDTILFDEFLPEDDVYLPDEVGKAMSFYMSVARGYGQVIREEVKFVFLANNVTLNNPYFRELGIRDRIQVGVHYTVDPDRAWVVEMFNNAEIANKIASTPFGKMLAKTQYGDFALKSQFMLDDPTFIQKPTGASRYFCTLVWNGESYGVYEYYEEGLYYVSKNVDPQCKTVFALTTKDHKPNYILLERLKYDPIFTFLVHAYNHALIRFDSDDAKFMFLDMMSVNQK